MATVTGIGATATDTTATSRTQLNQNFDSFLKLLTTQLQNQDPMAPMDSEKFTNQLVMFSQVEQQIGLNDKMTKMLNNNAAQLSQGALGYIGLDVETEGASFAYTAGTSVNIGYTLPADVQSVDVQIYDSNAQVVWQGSAKSTLAGPHKVAWNGKDLSGNAVKAGNYTVSMVSRDAENTSKQVATTVPGRVTGVETTDAGVMLNINNTLVPLSAVLSASKPATT